MQAGDVDHLLTQVDAGDLRAGARQRLAQQAAAAADIGHADATQIDAGCDIGRAHRVEVVQRTRLAVWIPPACSQLVETGDFLGTDIGGL